MRPAVLKLVYGALVLLVVAGSVTIDLTVLPGVGAQDKPESLTEARQERREVRGARAEAARQLDAAKAADAEVAEALAAITDLVNARQLELEDARRRLAEAEALAADATARVEAAGAEAEALRDQVAKRAVEGFLEASNPVLDDGLLRSADPNEAVRRNSLLQLAGTDTDDAIEALRGVSEDRRIAEAEARDAVEEAVRIEADITSILSELEQQRAVQAELKAEMEARVADWKAEVAAAEAAEEELSEFIRAEEAKLAPPAPTGGTSSSGVSNSGFQWPINARVSSEFGYRIHPIYRTRRLHAGIDLGAGSGTPIRAAADGTVLSAGWRGGYGNAVVISHGGGISTLYAHQSSIAVSAGTRVPRGQVIGYVGSTGQSTGPHLHFEVRVNGSPTNPRAYLP